MQEDFEDTKGVIRILKSNKDRQREPPTIGKQLVNFITWGCESSAPFL